MNFNIKKRKKNKAAILLKKYHRIRKLKEPSLPAWKEKWNSFNARKLGRLERFVEIMLPWLVLLLLFLLVGELGRSINVFGWRWLDFLGGFFEERSSIIKIFDQVIIGFFIVDLYFNFFKKATLWKFVKTSFLDILAVAPLGLLFRVTGLAEAQSAIHVAAEAERATAQISREQEVVSRTIREAEELAKLRKATWLSRLSRIPRFLRLYRIFGIKESREVIRKKSKKLNRKVDKIRENLRK